MNKKIIITLISLISGLALVFIFVGPFWFSIKDLREEITQRKSEITKIEELLAKVQQLNQEYQGLEEEAQKIFSALPKEKDIPHLLVQFDNLASSNGLLLESIEFGQISRPLPPEEFEGEQVSTPISNLSKTMPTSSSLAVNLTVSGSYNAFERYLTALEKNVRSMDVHSIQFKVDEKEGEASILIASGIFEFDLRISVYYQ